MGNSIATTMVEKQKEVQQEMIKVQWANMLRGAERQRRMMLSTQIAVMREQFWWYASFVGTVSLMATAAYVKKRTPAGFIPLVPLSFILGYQYDFAYGNKPERINRIWENMLTKEPHWFAPLTPTEGQFENLLDLDKKAKK
jgi:hypothetical protein